MSSKIGWCDVTWNPIRGCSHVSAGCDRCYAERMASRWSEGAFYGFAEAGKWTGRVELIESRLDLPLHWRKPLRVFVNSASDLFHESLSFRDTLRVYHVMSRATRHDFLILTKRPRQMIAWYEEAAERISVPAMPAPPNVHIGVSVENRKTLARLDGPRRIPAAVRFVSFEPLLEDLGIVNLDGIDWVVCGSETGSGARLCNPDWIRSLRDQCIAAGVPFWLKQLGVVAERDRVLDGRTWEELPRLAEVRA